MSKGHSKGKRVQREAEIVLAGWRGYDDQDDADLDKIEAYIEHLRDKIAYQRRRSQQLEGLLGVTRDPVSGVQNGGPELPPVPPAERAAAKKGGFSLRDMASDLRQQGTSDAYQQLDGMIDRAMGAERQGRSFQQTAVEMGVIMPPHHHPYAGDSSFVPPYGVFNDPYADARRDTLGRGMVS